VKLGVIPENLLEAWRDVGLKVQKPKRMWFGPDLMLHVSSKAA
jgi:hypothetical protein